MVLSPFLCLLKSFDLLCQRAHMIIHLALYNTEFLLKPFKLVIDLLRDLSSFDLSEEKVCRVLVIWFNLLHLVTKKCQLSFFFAKRCLRLKPKAWFRLLQFCRFKVRINGSSCSQNLHFFLIRVIAIVLQLVDHLLIEAIEAKELIQVLALEGWPAALKALTV